QHRGRRVERRTLDVEGNADAGRAQARAIEVVPVTHLVDPRFAATLGIRDRGGRANVVGVGQMQQVDGVVRAEERYLVVGASVGAAGSGAIEGGGILAGELEPVSIVQRIVDRQRQLLAILARVLRAVVVSLAVEAK